MPVSSDPSTLLSVDEAAAMLRISRATFYRLPFFRAKKVQVSPHRVAYDRKDVDLYITLQRGRQDGRARAA